MNIAKIAKICEKSGVLYIADNVRTCEQWVGNGVAAYFVDAEIEVTENNAVALFDFTKDKEKQPQIRRCRVPNDEVYASRRVTDEEILEVIGSIAYGGAEMLALKSEGGMMFIDTAYLKPVNKTMYLEFYLRKSGNIPCVAVYDSIFCCAVIAPRVGAHAEDVKANAVRIAVESVYAFDGAQEDYVDQVTIDDLHLEGAEGE